MRFTDLRALADRAMPGKWTADQGMVYGPNLVSVAETMNGFVGDAAYIAAFDPSTARLLLDVAEAADEFIHFVDTGSSADRYVARDGLRAALERLEAAE